MKDPPRPARATIVQVAHVAGVSRSTVSNALNAPHRLQPDTLAQVRAAIDQLGYQRSRAARSLRTHASRQIGYCIGPYIPHTASGLMDRFLHALAEASQAEGYFLVLFTARDTIHELSMYEEMLRAGAVDGFVISGGESHDERPQWLLQRHVQFVSFGRAVHEGQLWVDVDGAAGVEAAVNHLVDRGHRRIAFLGWPAGSALSEERGLGWRRALDRHGLGAEAHSARAIDDTNEAAHATLELLDAKQPPTAIVTVSDTLAMGCILAAQQRRLAVGRDLAVVGFDDTPTAELHSPSLTSVHQPLAEIGRTVIRLLTARLEGRPVQSSGVLLNPTLVIRESSSRRIPGAPVVRPRNG